MARKETERHWEEGPVKGVRDQTVNANLLESAPSGRGSRGRRRRRDLQATTAEANGKRCWPSSPNRSGDCQFVD